MVGTSTDTILQPLFLLEALAPAYDPLYVYTFSTLPSSITYYPLCVQTMSSIISQKPYLTLVRPSRSLNR